MRYLDKCFAEVKDLHFWAQDRDGLTANEKDEVRRLRARINTAIARLRTTDVDPATLADYERRVKVCRRHIRNMLDLRKYERSA